MNPTYRLLREKNGNHEAVAAASPVRMKPCTFWRNTFLSGIENAVFMWVQDLLCQAHLQTHIIRGKAKSCYENLKQKEGEESKAGDFNASKGWFDNFRKRFGF